MSSLPLDLQKAISELASRYVKSLDEKVSSVSGAKIAVSVGESELYLGYTRVPIENGEGGTITYFWIYGNINGKPVDRIISSNSDTYNNIVSLVSMEGKNPFVAVYTCLLKGYPAKDQ